MKRANKYLYVWNVQGNFGYGDGWEDLCASESRKEAREDLKAHRWNAPEYSYRLIFRREPNPEFIAL